MTDDRPLPAGLALQPRAARTLEQTMRARTAHAYLLSGSYGAGTLDAATWLAAAALCPNGGGDGCEVCRRVERHVHPDLIWLRAEGQTLARDQIDALVEQLVRRPFEAERQVAVIEDAETLSSTNAVVGNALLKVLEEPPGDVLFVLLARSAAQLLPTLRSRVIEVPFRPVPDAGLVTALAERGIDDAAVAHLGMSVASLARLAGGDLARALDLAAGGESLTRHRLALQVGLGLAGGRLEPGDAAAMLQERCDAAAGAATAAAEEEFGALLETMAPQDAGRFKNSRDADGMEARVKRRARRAMSDEVRTLLGELASVWRDLVAAAVGAPVRNVDAEAEIAALRSSPSALRAVAALDAIDELPIRLVTNVDVGVALESLCAELAALAENRIRSRRAFGASARTPAGLELAL